MTIDPATARDFDDAISLSRDRQRPLEPRRSTSPMCRTLFGRARPSTARRGTAGTSVYLPDRVIPMLPEILSNSLASLQAGRTRYTVSAIMDLYSRRGS